MKSMTFKNRMNGERFVCDDVRTVEVIDGIEYMLVRRPGLDRRFLMRKDALEKEVITVKKNVENSKFNF